MRTVSLTKGAERGAVVYKDTTCEVGVGEVLRVLGARNGSAPSRTVRKIKSLIKELRDDLEPKILVSDKDILACGEDRLVLDPGVELRSKKLCRTLRKCDTAKVFVATVGNKIEKKIKKAMEKKRSDVASIIDAIASVAVEDTIETFHSRIDLKLRAKEQCATLRFSPGYCDWDIKEQKNLFKVIDSEKVGVTLSESSLMSPRKSISGIFGIGRCGTVANKTNNPCTRCGKKDCNTRRQVN